MPCLLKETHVDRIYYYSKALVALFVDSGLLCVTLGPIPRNRLFTKSPRRLRPSLLHRTPHQNQFHP
jgi:hypothetical protein